MDIEELLTRLRAIVDEQERLTTAPEGAADDWDLDEAASTRFEELEAEAAPLRTKIADIRRRQKAIKDSADVARVGGDDTDGNRGRFDPPNINRGGDPFDIDTVRIDASATDLRARVATGLERDSVTPDAVKESIAGVLRTVHGDPRSAAMRCIATGSELYRSAFGKMATGRQDLWTDEERQAVARAQSLTDAAGGFAVPFTLDPTLILTDQGSIDPLRRIGRVVQTTTESWNGVSAGAASWSWDAEAAEVSDDSLTLAQPSIPVHKAQGFIPFSVEIEGDWAAIDSDLRRALMEGKENLEALAHIKGSGSGQPTGIETALDGGSSEIAPQTAETFASADVDELQRLLPPRHRQAGPTWVMNIGTSNTIRGFDTAGGGNYWGNRLDGVGDRLLMWPWEEASNVDDAPDIDAGATADNFILFVGAWQNYVLVDRIGMSVEFVPHLFATGANRPSGQRGLWAWARHGADSVNDDAFRVLSIPTAA